MDCRRMAFGCDLPRNSKKARKIRGVNHLLRNSVIRWDTNSSALGEGLVYEPVDRTCGDEFPRPPRSNRLFED